MGTPVTIVERVPRIAEYCDLIDAVGFRRRDPIAVEVALRNSYFAVCAEADGRIVGCGRVIGDGGLHYYLTDVVVHPAYQRRGIGTRIVEALTRFTESVPYINTVVGVLPTAGTEGFYGRHGYRAQGPDAPAMLRWLNRTDG